MLNTINAKQCLQRFGRTPRRMLIVGCGTGADVKPFNELIGAGLEIHALDVRDDLGRDYAAENVVYIKADIAELPVCSRSYDLAYSYATFEHVPRIQQGWQRMVDSLRPGGMLYSVAAPLWCSPFGHHKKNIFSDYPYIHLRYPTPEALTQFCLEKGITAPDGKDIRNHVRYMLRDDCFNKLRARDYLHAGQSLTGCTVEKNALDLVPDGVLSGFDDLLAAGYTRDDLLGQTHRLIATAL